jgi:hypothetical protein
MSDTNELQRFSSCINLCRPGVVNKPEYNQQLQLREGFQVVFKKVDFDENKNIIVSLVYSKPFRTNLDFCCTNQTSSSACLDPGASSNIGSGAELDNLSLLSYVTKIMSERDSNVG